jgi:hypothetical protein
MPGHCKLHPLTLINRREDYKVFSDIGKMESVKRKEGEVVPGLN